MAISTPAKTQINVVATTFDHPAKTNLGTIRTGSYLTQASMLVYDDILRFQNSTPKNDIIDTLTAKQKKAIYAGIKTIYQPMYGVSGSPYYDETYFNLLKGYVGSYFYKEYPWFNTNDTLNIFEFAALNLGNALYQFIDAVWTDETIREAYNDYAEQGMGVYRAWQEQGNDTTYFVRDELKDKRIKINLWDDSGSGETGIVVYAGFDAKGELVVWDSASYPSIGTTADISRFNYNEFEGNILWFMDELVGMESDWIQDASPGIEGNTAYGYVQFTEESVETAVNRYIGHLERFNARRNTRDWEPYSIKRGEILPTPEWLTTLKNSTKTHEEKLDALTYDEMLALAFVHLHSKDSKDSNFVLLSQGDIYASKEIYKNNHHTNPDTATLSRMEDFWPWRKQNKYVEKLAHSVSSVPTAGWMYKSCPGDANQTMTPNDVINCLKSKLTFHSGDELFTAMQNEVPKWNSVWPGYLTITDETANISTVNLGAYSSYDSNVANKSLSTGSNYRVLKRKTTPAAMGTTIDPPVYSYYFWRTGNLHDEWLQNVKTELTDNAHHYNYDELCQSIGSWNVNTHHTYIVDWFNTDIADANYIVNKGAMSALTAGFSWNNININSTGLIVIGLSLNNIRKQLGTLIHEAGGHAGHPLNWGGEHQTTSGDRELFTTTQNEHLHTLYQLSNYISLSYNRYWNKFPDTLLATPIHTPASIALEDKIWNSLPMSSLIWIGGYDVEKIEDEFLARVYSMMAMNKCITFTDDIWPVMKEVTPLLATGRPFTSIIDINLARKIDTDMRENMLLNMRTYNLGQDSLGQFLGA
jgi:hypothetical protein